MESQIYRELRDKYEKFRIHAKENSSLPFKHYQAYKVLEYLFENDKIPSCDSAQKEIKGLVNKIIKSRQ